MCTSTRVLGRYPKGVRKHTHVVRGSKGRGWAPVVVDLLLDLRQGRLLSVTENTADVLTRPQAQVCGGSPRQKWGWVLGRRWCLLGIPVALGVDAGFLLSCEPREARPMPARSLLNSGLGPDARLEGGQNWMFYTPLGRTLLKPPSPGVFRPCPLTPNASLSFSYCPRAGSQGCKRQALYTKAPGGCLSWPSSSFTQQRPSPWERLFPVTCS